METVIWFLKDEEGKAQVKLCLQELIQRAKADPLFTQLVELIFQAIEFVEKRGMIHSMTEFFTTSLEGNSLYSIRVIKELRDHPPLLEFRVNWRGAGAFRAICFEYSLENVQMLVFTQATLKARTYSEEFVQLIKKSEEQYIAFMKSPEKHIFSQGDEMDE
jgi:hypothetical protein